MFDKKGDPIPGALDKLKTPRDALIDEINNGTRLNEENKNILRETSAHLASELGSDDGLDTLLTKGYRNILMRGDGVPRSLDSVKAKIAGIKANLSEISSLRQISEKTYNAGVDALVQLDGKSLPEGCITRCLQLSADVNLDSLRSLDGKSSQLELFNAVCNLNNKIYEIMAASGIKDNIEGADEISACENIVTISILANLSTEERDVLSKAFNSLKYSKLLTFMENNLRSKHNFKGAIPEKEVGSGVMLNIAKRMREIKVSLETLMGKEPTGIPRYVGQIDNNSEYRTIIDTTFSLAKQEIENKINDFTSKFIIGEDADFIRNKVKLRMRESVKNTHFVSGGFNAHEAFSAITGKALNPALSEHMIDTVKNAANHRPTAFEQGLGKVSVDLPDGSKLSADPNAALDELSHLVTGNNEAHFAQLDAINQKKVRILSSFLTAQFANLSKEAFPLSLNDNQKNPLFTIAGRDLHENSEISVSLKNGTDFVITAKYHAEFSNLFKQDNSLLITGEGSSLKNEVKMTISADELERLAGLDFDDGNEDFNIDSYLVSSMSINLK